MHSVDVQRRKAFSFTGLLGVAMILAWSGTASSACVDLLIDNFNVLNTSQTDTSLENIASITVHESGDYALIDATSYYFDKGILIRLLQKPSDVDPEIEIRYKYEGNKLHNFIQKSSKEIYTTQINYDSRGRKIQEILTVERGGSTSPVSDITCSYMDDVIEEVNLGEPYEGDRPSTRRTYRFNNDGRLVSVDMYSEHLGNDTVPTAPETRLEIIYSKDGTSTHRIVDISSGFPQPQSERTFNETGRLLKYEFFKTKSITTYHYEDDPIGNWTSLSTKTKNMFQPSWKTDYQVRRVITYK